MCKYLMFKESYNEIPNYSKITACTRIWTDYSTRFCSVFMSECGFNACAALSEGVLTQSSPAHHTLWN